MLATTSRFYHDADFCRVFTLVGDVNVPRPTMPNGKIPLGDIHPDVIPHPKTPGSYIMVWTPYPASGTGDPWSEFPTIAISTDKLNWSLYPGADVPIIYQGGAIYIADPDILYLDDIDRYRIWYSPGDTVRTETSLSNSGEPTSFTDSGVTGYPSTAGTWGYDGRGSSVLRNKVTGKYIMYYDGRNRSGGPGGVGRLNIGRVTGSDGVHWDASVSGQPMVDGEPVVSPDGYGIIWHMSVRFFDGCYYMLGAQNNEGVYGNADIWAYKSIDGIEWEAIGCVIPYTSLPVREGKNPDCGYRVSMCFENNIMYAWVSYNVGYVVDNTFTTVQALYKTELSTAGTADLNYTVRDYEQGGKVITGTPRLYSGEQQDLPISTIINFNSNAPPLDTPTTTTTAAPTTTTTAAPPAENSYRYLNYTVDGPLRFLTGSGKFTIGFGGNGPVRIMTSASVKVLL